ncbi:MAG: aconitate hydratase AcnA, partial [Candidatus Omnitrophica bacterium]|nr:aconitate hydratase AcnA [Candidatus Omnitrophota bacterium]
ATISNMCPEYGATIGIFPIDDETLNYYRLTGKTEAKVNLIEHYFKEQQMFYYENTKPPRYSKNIELDLTTVKMSLAGPRRPQDRIIVTNLKESFNKTLSDIGVKTQTAEKKIKVKPSNLNNGSVVIASITSCTNTSNPSVLIGAGLLAKKACEKGLTVPDFVKTSFAPGSQVVEEYMSSSGLLPYLEKLKFHIVGYGCATCIGNSGPLADSIVKEIHKKNLIVSSVLSGNRNFEGRISPHTKVNYLASPALVVAYAIAGTVDINLENDPLGKDNYGENVFLKDIWPTQAEINAAICKNVKPSSYKKRYKNMDNSNLKWNAIKTSKSSLYPWKKSSTYIQEPPFFKEMERTACSIKPVEGARVLVKVGDSITTDHISPAGSIAEDSPAGKYLISQGVKIKDFNSYGSRRGNDKVMTRGTFANIRLKNELAAGTEGSWTNHFPSNKIMSIYDASCKYKEANTPLVVLAGKEYGTGSSRDWAAKGTALLGVKVVLAQSYERIHRSNLAGMGILPLEFMEGESVSALALEGNEIFNFMDIDNNLKPRSIVTVVAESPSGKINNFKAIVRLDTPVEIDYYRNGGILQTVLRKLSKT